MKTRITFVVMSLVVGGLGLGISAEHPEHPAPMKSSNAKEHPKEHPNTPSQKAFRNEYEKFVKDYIESEAQKTGGVYTIRDDAENKDWKLKLAKVHKNKICMLQEGKSCFACADLKEVDGKNKLDLDFYANKSADGKLTMDKVLIHKVNGKPRFTYDSQNNMVPMK